jgi:hypothetical protein
MKSSFSILSVLAGLAVLLGAPGCAGESAEDAEGADVTASTESELSVPNPSGAYVASVTANGKGCGRGTYDAEISRDGKTFDIVFHAYEAAVDPGSSFSVSDCNISIALKSPGGLSFAVKSFSFDGQAELDRGVRASLTAKYYFQGNPMAAGETRQELIGPFDDTFVFADNVAAKDIAWSPCGRERNLNAMTRVFVRNNSGRTGSGVVSIAANEMRLRVNLAWRSC